MRKNKEIICFSKNKIIAALTVALSLASASALSAETGVMRFHGEVQDVACSISGMDGLNQTINMETASVKQLTNGGEGPKKEFKIALEACDIATHKLVNVAFRGQADANNKDAFSDQSGDTTHVGLILRDAGGKVINPTTGTATKDLVNGDQNMYFSANLIGTSTTNAPTAGRFDTSVNVELNYQ